MKFEEVENEVRELELSINEINQSIKDSISAGKGALCGSCEFFFVGVARRTGAITQIFCRAIRDDNHYAAPALIRLNLEHLLVLHAGQVYETGDLHDFTSKLLEGKRPRDLKNKDGKKMFERELVMSLGKELDHKLSRPLKDLYDWCNNFTHFGTPNLYSAIQNWVEKGHLTLLLAKPTFEIPDVQATDLRNWIGMMQAINSLIQCFFDQWSITKDATWGSG